MTRAFGLTMLLAGLLALGACAHKQVAKAAPTPPPPPPAPTLTLKATPGTITQGQSTQLEWQSQNASQVTVTGLGTLPASGSRSVRPAESTTYEAVASGPGGTQEASTRVTVNPVAAASNTPGPSLEELFRQSVHDVYFDYDKYNIRVSEQTASASDAKFLLDHPGAKVLIEGHCDDRGSEEYNLALGDSRASATRDALIKAGINQDRVKTISYGKERPFCSSDDESCWQQNRRAHFVLQQ